MELGKTVRIAGFAMFSMFFGSGNLVIPLVIGTQSLSNSIYATIGLIFTGVLVPFLGLIGVILYAGNRDEYFGCIGKKTSLFLTFAMLSMMGPMGVLPRCIIVSYGEAILFFPKLSLPDFGILFCLITLLIIWKHNRVIPVIGRILTPLLLIGITIISIAGLFFSENTITPSNIDIWKSFTTGLFEGYQTMDLLAAFFFSATTVSYIRANLHSTHNPKALLKTSLYASILGAGCIGIIYVAFVALGAKHASSLMDIRPELLLSNIAKQTLGPVAIPLVALTITLACLSTAAIPAMLFAEFLQKIFRERISHKESIIITLAASLCISLIGFDALTVWINNVLRIVYPALIVLTIGNIAYKTWNIPNFGRWGFWLTTIANAAFYFI